jgi:hypothetical protein
MKRALVVITAAFLFCSTLMAQGDNELSRKSLKGLTGVWVGIEPLDPDAEKDGLSEDQIQTDVELRLRMAGIKVLTQEQRLATPGMPLLYIRLNTFIYERSYPFSINISLIQSVSLKRDPQISIDQATTWNVGDVGCVGPANVKQIRDVIKDHVDKFINAWLSVNPKK